VVTKTLDIESLLGEMIVAGDMVEIDAEVWSGSVYNETFWKEEL
jgi:hypothetical protein